MSYHVALELTPEQKMRLKMTATSRNQSVKDFVTELVVKSIGEVQSTKTKNKKVGGTT